MKKKNYTRIISGLYKGMIIKIPKNKKIRPTLITIKKTLFDWINNFIQNKKCLDCFSGSGSLSIESLSRKALHVTILEKNKKTIKIIKNNLKKINKKKYKIIKTNTIKWLKNNKIYFDIIFIDPPYKKNYINKIIKIIEKNKIAKKNSLIYIETYKNKKIKIPNTWILYKKKKTQTSKHILYIHK